MKQHVLITGTGREMALGFNFVRRYLEQGDHVIATIRKPSPALENLQAQYPDTLSILTMDIGSTESVNAAAEKAAQLVPCLDLIINNAVTTSPDINKELEDFDLDTVMPALNVATVGPLRVIKAFLPLLRKSEGTALIVNISSEAGSIGACYRTTYIDYGMAKAALNMATKTLHNKFKDDPKLNIICVHPGWVRTNPGNAKAPFDPYEHAETMRLLFEEKRCDKEGPIFVTYAGEEYPW
ncbi:MAG: SDR family NAD(P)-dependent oxidoreductase [Clostridiales bacterium]|nr:SDR family NAD(P)-dependent oxidoreductase [Clostridiales bacterium]